MNVPAEPWDQLAYLLNSSLPANATASCEWVNTEYLQRKKLASLRDFLVRDFLEAPRSDMEALDRVWFFPWTECATELHIALAQSFCAMHRAAYDHQRRALELAVVGALFVEADLPADQARAWMESRDPTPMFTRALKRIATRELCANLNLDTGWVGLITAHYWTLSDAIHVRGEAYSSASIQPASLSINGFPVPEFNPRALERTLDSFVTTFEHIATVLAIANPILLFDVPIEQKFGINGPLSGFFVEAQVELLLEILPAPIRISLKSRAADVPSVKSVLVDFASRPDISQEELRQQIDEFNRSFNIDPGTLNP